MTMTLYYRVLVRIAGIVFSISSDHNINSVHFEEAYKDFLCDDEPEVVIHARYGSLPYIIPLKDNDRVFDSGTVWSLYRIDGQNALVLGASDLDSIPYRIALFDNDVRQIEVYSEAEQLPAGLLLNPLQYPLGEVLMICLLAKGCGLMVHACGIEDEGRGYIFAGNSGHGKSTIAKLWKDRALVLNDDRIIIRKRDGIFWIFGTPWHGDYNKVSPNGVPLEKVFFLRHADTNTVHLREGITAASMLLTRCFPPVWDAEGMRFTLDFCARLVETVPCYELGFVPDDSITNFVRCVK